MPINDSGFYKIEVDQTEMNNNNQFSSVFRPYVTSIRTHGAGRVDETHRSTPKTNYLVKKDDGKMYLNSNLMRDQMDGLLRHLKNIAMEERDYSNTGAARTVLLRYSKVINTTCNPIVKLFLSMFPDVKVDYVPQFSISYDQLPLKAKTWMNRSSTLLTSELKDKVRSRGGTLVAKYAKDCGEDSSITWRIAISPMDILRKDAYSGCNVIDVLVILKDIRVVALARFSRHDFSTYHIKSGLLWAMDQTPGLNRQELIDVTLKKLSSFYANRHLPDFFIQNCNLIKSVPEQIAKDISDLLEHTRVNFESVIDACKKRQIAFRHDQKSNVAKVITRTCVLRMLVLKIFLTLMKWFPRLSNYVISKCFNYVLLKILFGNDYKRNKNYPYEELKDIFLRQKDHQFQRLLSETALSISDMIIKLLD